MGWLPLRLGILEMNKPTELLLSVHISPSPHLRKCVSIILLLVYYVCHQDNIAIFFGLVCVTAS